MNAPVIARPEVDYAALPSETKRYLKGSAIAFMVGAAAGVLLGIVLGAGMYHFTARPKYAFTEYGRQPIRLNLRTGETWALAPNTGWFRIREEPKWEETTPVKSPKYSDLPEDATLIE